MPTTKPGKDQGNVALPKMGKPFTSKHSQDLFFLVYVFFLAYSFANASQGNAPLPSFILLREYVFPL